jgi:hypothetical protein
MKTVLCIVFLILACIATGCTSTSPAATPVSAIPLTPSDPGLSDLTGTWAGPMQGYDEGVGFTDYPDLKIALVVEEQHGRVFSGKILFTANGSHSSTGFAGIIGRDNRTFTFTEKDGGYCTGEILGNDEIEITYLHDGSPYSAAVDSLKRV